MLPRCWALALCALGCAAPRATAGEVLGSPFVRGDTNASGQLDVSDGIAILQHLFGGDAPPPCLAAADLNADAVLDVTDGVALFTFLFLGRGMPPPPYPDCGYPESPEGELGCESFMPCETFTVVTGSPPPPPAEAIHRSCLGGDIAPPLVLEPELFDALTHLAPGEPVLALQDLPGFREYMEQTRVFTAVPPYPWSVDDYTPTVCITVESSEDEPCFEVTPEVIESIREQLVFQQVLDPAVPLESIAPSRVCGEGKHGMLVTGRKPDGAKVVHSGVIKVETKRPPTKSVQVQVRSPIPPAGPRLTDAFRCEWGVVEYLSDPAEPRVDGDGETWNIFGYGVQQKDPEDETEDGFGSGRDGWYVSKGGGPWIDMLARRWAANCHSPPTTLSHTAGGEVQTNLGLFCSEDGSRASTTPCQTVIRATAYYESGLQVSSEAGIWCHIFGANDIEAFVQSRATFTIHKEVVFDKATLLANGNNVTSEISCELGAKLKPGEGPSLNANIGYREIIDRDTGRRTELLSCEATDQTSLVPATLKLEAKGTARLNGYNATAGWACLLTGACGLWFVAESTCPEAGRTAGAYLVGIPDRVKVLQGKAESFLTTRGYTGPIDWNVPAKTDTSSEGSEANSEESKEETS